MPSSHGEHFVFDTSCLNYFARVGRLDLLQQRYAGRAHAALEVKAELEKGVVLDGAITTAVEATWISWERVAGMDELDAYGQALKIVGQRGKGEAATVALAAHRGWRAVLDDNAARKYADRQGIPFTGTIGILVAVAATGELRPPEAWNLLEHMRALGFHAKMEWSQFEALVDRW